MPFHAAINIQNLTAIFLHFITVINRVYGGFPHKEAEEEPGRDPAVLCGREP